MNRYSPLWSQVVDSSLWCEPDFVVKVFLTMIAKKDMDDIVRGSAFNIAQWAKKTETEVLEAFKVLSSPDTRRVEPQKFEGRRIEKVPEGWLVLNGAHYRSQMAEEARRQYKRQWQAQKRKLDKEKARDAKATGMDGSASSALTKHNERRGAKAYDNGDTEKGDAIAAGEA